MSGDEEDEVNVFQLNVDAAMEAVETAKESMKVSLKKKPAKGSTLKAMTAWSKNHAVVMKAVTTAIFDLEQANKLVAMEPKEPVNTKDRVVLTPSGHPMWTFGPNTTRRHASDFLQKLSSFFVGKGFVEKDGNWVRSLLMVMKDPTSAYQTFIQTFIDEKKSWDDTCVEFINEFGVFDFTLGAAHVCVFVCLKNANSRLTQYKVLCVC
jgi:hypothetical protein